MMLLFIALWGYSKKVNRSKEGFATKATGYRYGDKLGIVLTFIDNQCVMKT